MWTCRLCERPVSTDGAVVIDTPAGTQLFSDDAVTALALQTRISVVECMHCSLIQLTGDPVVYEQVSSSSSCVSEPLTEHRLGQLRALVSMSAATEGSGRMLEIGCGDGYLLDRAKGMFDTVVGIEPTSRNATTAAARGLDIRQMLMGRGAVVEGSPFDYFCCFHVMEHVTQISSVLNGVLHVLSEDAVGIIEVPATEAAIAQQRFGDFMPDHLNYFTEVTLRTALEWNGFAVEKIYRDWGGEHLVAYVRKRGLRSNIGFIAERQKMLDGLVAEVSRRGMPFVIWGVSHHLLPYISILGKLEQFSAVDGSPSKVDRYIPSTALKVRPINTLRALNRGYVAVTAPRFRDEIVGELTAMFGSAKEDDMLSKALGFPVFECSSPRAQ
jgi:hypothetical protein